MPSRQTTSGVDLLVPEGTGGPRQRIEGAIREAITSGRLTPRAALPSTRALARDLGVARSTVVDAYAQLSAEGWITGARGSGTTVADGSEHAPPPPPATSDVTSRRFDFTPGRPDVSAFPRSGWLGALRRALREAPGAVFDYGDVRGHPELRDQVAAYVGRVRGARVHPDHLVITAGFGEALSLAGRVLAATTRGAQLAMEDPCLAHHRAIAAATGLGLVPVTVDGEGARVEQLEGSGAAGILLTPAHQQPIGVSLSASRRGWVLDWARRTGALVVEDDYDSEFRFDRSPLGALQGRAPDVVAYVGTVSKTLAPGVRLGWIAMPPDLVDAAAAQKEATGGQHGVLDQLALTEMIRSGAYDRHVRRMRLRYRGRRDVLLQMLAERAPAVQVSGIEAGLQALVELPEGGPTPEEVTAAAAARDVSLHTVTEHHWHVEGGMPPSIIVGYGTPAEHVYREALQALLATFRDVGLVVA
jgi:GntR family transcriptional regulator/MocR family aminotransferase